MHTRCTAIVDNGSASYGVVEANGLNGRFTGFPSPRGHRSNIGASFSDKAP